jgi:hypothetical protein
VSNLLNRFSFTKRLTLPHTESCIEKTLTTASASGPDSARPSRIASRSKKRAEYAKNCSTRSYSALTPAKACYCWIHHLGGVLLLLTDIKRLAAVNTSPTGIAGGNAPAAAPTAAKPSMHFWRSPRWSPMADRNCAFLLPSLRKPLNSFISASVCRITSATLRAPMAERLSPVRAL